MEFNFLTEAQKVMRNSGRHYCPNCATINYRIKTANFIATPSEDCDDVNDIALICSCNNCEAEWEQMATLYIDENDVNVLDEGDLNKDFHNIIREGD